MVETLLMLAVSAIGCVIPFIRRILHNYFRSQRIATQMTTQQ
jgi:hypothetical protein